MTESVLFDPNLGEGGETVLPEALVPSEAPLKEEKERIRLIKGVVVSAVKETSDTWTLHIFVGNKDKNYKAGQFISISAQQFPELQNWVSYLEHVKGKKELVRAYSLTSAPYEPYVSITIKPEQFVVEEMDYPPLLSPFLASNVLQGKEIEFLGYAGSYVIKPEQAAECEQVLHLCAGSGIVPNFSLLKDELMGNKNSHLHHVLVDVNRTVEDIIFKSELDKLAFQYPERLKLLHLLTREEHPQKYGNNYFKGRPTLDFISRLLKNPATTLVYACGAGITKWQRKKAEETGTLAQPRFLESVQEIVKGLQIDKKRFKREVYG